MKRNLFLQSVGLLLLLSWALIFGSSTITLISLIFNNEPYYFDNTFLYCLAFALAPFVLNSYMNGLSLVGDKNSLIRQIQLKINFLLLTLFALLLLLISLGFFLSFVETFKDLPFSLEWLLLSIPLVLIIAFGFLSRFLYQSSVQK